MSSRIKKGDQVMVISGRDRGRSGRVLAVHPTKGQVLVEGVNTAKKAVRATPDQPAGGFQTVAQPLATAKVMPICPSCKKPTRVRMRIVDDRKVRVCQKCDSLLEQGEN